MERKTFIRTLGFCSGVVLVNPVNLLAKSNKSEYLKISMIYNNIASDSSLKDAWGLAVWIETEKEAILFDTGGDASTLMKNIKQSKLNLDKLTKIVISHNHWDHKNGLKQILKETSNKPEVFIVENDASAFAQKLPDAKIKSVTKAKEISKYIWTTGVLHDLNAKNIIYEQSLILVQENSIILLTGCSHSGIVDMVSKTSKLFPHKTIELVAGGFHLMRKSMDEVQAISDSLKQFNIKKLAPSHCTGKDAIALFRKEWDNNFIDFNLGDKYINT